MLCNFPFFTQQYLVSTHTDGSHSSVHLCCPSLRTPGSAMTHSQHATKQPPLPFPAPSLHTNQILPQPNFSLVCYMPIVLISVLFSQRSLTFLKSRKTPLPHFCPERHTHQFWIQVHLIFETCLCHFLAVLSWQFAQPFWASSSSS